MQLDTYPVLEPMCRRSGLCNKVENGGGLYCPSRLPLLILSVMKAEEAHGSGPTFSH